MKRELQEMWDDFCPMPLLIPLALVILAGEGMLSLIERPSRFLRLVGALGFVPIACVSLLVAMPFVIVLVLLTPAWWTVLLLREALQKDK